jgi:hypothetical protein
MATLVLGGVTLPDPSEYEESEGYRGGGRLMTDGSVAFDLLSTTAKHEYTIGWGTLTAAQKTQVKNAFATVKNASAAFTTIEGASVTVTRAQDQESVKFTAVPVAGGALRWKTQMRLREV